MRMMVGVFLLVVAGVVAVARGEAPPAAPAREANLGRINFPVTGGDVARRHFVRGLLALHSFWYDEARDEFRAATSAEPDFAMGYWGEALTFFHPVWGEQNVDAEKKALDAAVAAAQPKLTERERAYLAAARELVGDGDHAAHAARYRDAMRALHQRWPDDDEAVALYAVAILGTLGGKSGYRLQAEAGALMLELFARNPEHPGAAHYIIHAFDDPDHARLALPAAQRYAQIAPAAFHALHMPSHTFVHLGMWTEAAAANEAAWAASLAWVARTKLDASKSDFHSLSWLHAIYLELGQRRKAAEVLGQAATAVAAAREDRYGTRLYYLQMAVKNAIDSDDLAHLDDKLAPLGSVEPPPPAATVLAAPLAKGCHPKESDPAKGARRERWNLAWARAEVALARRDATAAVKALSAMLATLTKEERQKDWRRAVELDLRGRVAALRGDLRTGIKLVTQAAELQDADQVPGPVEEGVPARERLGELLLAAGRPRDALAVYRKALVQHPRRARVLLGCARAATASGDTSAASYWTELGNVWANADADMPGLDEVRRGLDTR